MKLATSGIHSSSNNLLANNLHTKAFMKMDIFQFAVWKLLSFGKGKANSTDTERMQDQEQVQTHLGFLNFPPN